VVLPGLARFGVIWRGRVLRGRVQYGEVLHCKARHGVIWRCLVWLGFVRSCPARLGDVRHGFITALQGLELYCTVLSCPVRLSKALFCKVFRGMVLYGGAGSCPVGSSPVWLCRVWCFLARSGMVLHCKVQSCLAEHGKVPLRHSEVLRGGVLLSLVLQGAALFWQGGAAQSEVHYGKVSLWLGEVLFCVVGFIGVLYSRVRSYCGVVWNREALHRIVKFGPVKYCLVVHARALLRQGFALRGWVRRSKALLRFRMVGCGTVGSGFARLRAVGQALSFSGEERWGAVSYGALKHGHVR
jgi:hypothetical protein